MISANSLRAEALGLANEIGSIAPGLSGGFSHKKAQKAQEFSKTLLWFLCLLWLKWNSKCV
jgi:hypothetical protein